MGTSTIEVPATFPADRLRTRRRHNGGEECRVTVRPPRRTSAPRARRTRRSPTSRLGPLAVKAVPLSIDDGHAPASRARSCDGLRAAARPPSLRRRSQRLDFAAQLSAEVMPCRSARRRQSAAIESLVRAAAHFEMRHQRSRRPRPQIVGAPRATSSRSVWTPALILAPTWRPYQCGSAPHLASRPDERLAPDALERAPRASTRRTRISASGRDTAPHIAG